VSEPTPMTPIKSRAALGRECEGCGLHGAHLAHPFIHLTNGALTLCEQCLAEFNGKNPELAALRNDFARVTAERDKLQRFMRRIVAAYMPDDFPAQPLAGMELANAICDASRILAESQTPAAPEGVLPVAPCHICGVPYGGKHKAHCSLKGW
jgi:hypothetical protein